jgi:alpha-soluble NSF attachment protein
VQQGQKCIKEAKEKLKGGFFSGMFSSKKDRMEEAVRLYMEAAQQFKIAGSKEESIEALKSAAALYEALGDMGDAADALSAAGDLIGTDNSGEACELYKSAAMMFIKCGKSAEAAKIFRQIADIYEKEYEFELAVINLKEAGRLFEMEKFNKSDANKANIKIAELLSRDCDNASEAQLIESIKMFQKMGTKYSEDNLLRHSARELFYKACLLFLVLEDDVGLEKAIDIATDKDPFFNNSMEQKFLLRILECWRTNDMDTFSHECTDIGKRSTLDKWKINVIAAIKRKLEKRSGGSKKKGPDSKKEDIREDTHNPDFNPF